MKVMVYMGHPAHFHLFKYIIKDLVTGGDDVIIAIKSKDILENLLKSAEFSYINLLHKRRKPGKLHITAWELKKHKALFSLCRRTKPDFLIGTSSAMPLVGRLLGIPSINVNEDDASVIPMYARISYPFSSVILTPAACDNGKWEYKSIKYNSYHELAYLHPKYFSADKSVVEKYIRSEKPFYLIRFSNLDAHHDKGISGISHPQATELLSILKPHGDVYISSERPLPPALENHRIAINPLDIHHIMAFSRIFIGDSQTMCAEAGVLGTPFIRFNDFVGRIGYLRELEDKYGLGFGIKTIHSNKLIHTVEDLLKIKDSQREFLSRRQNMLKDKIDLNKLILWLLLNYPESASTLYSDPNYSKRFGFGNLYGSSDNNKRKESEAL